MTGQITKIQEKKSQFGDVFFYVFFKMSDGKSAKSCVYRKFGNFRRWSPVIEKWKALKDSEPLIVLEGLNVRGNLVDADSLFVVVNHN